MGETWTPFGFADFKYYENTKKLKPADGAFIYFNNEWATEKVSEIINTDPWAVLYAFLARGEEKCDIKTKVPKGMTIAFGSLLFGKYASARDAGNIAAGIVNQRSNWPSFLIDYGFGVYNMAGNNVRNSFEIIKIDMTLFLMNISMGTNMMLYRADHGEEKLSKAGIEVGKKNKLR